MWYLFTAQEEGWSNEGVRSPPDLLNHGGGPSPGPESRSNPYLLILPSQGVLFCPAKGKQTVPISIHIFFPFGQGASKEYTMRNEIIKRVTKAGRNEALSFSSGFSAHTLQELKKKRKKETRKKKKRIKKQASKQ